MLLRPGRKTTAETTTDVLYRVRILLIVNCREVRRRTTAELFWSAQWPATVRCPAVSETVCLSIQTSKQIYEMRTEIPIPSPPPLVFRKELFPLYQITYFCLCVCFLLVVRLYCSAQLHSGCTAAKCHSCRRTVRQALAEHPVLLPVFC